MKQIEVTTYVNNTLEEIDSILTNQGFKIIRKSRIEDKYMTLSYDKLNKNNILDILSECVLIRYLCVNNNEEFKKITYKKKTYDGNTVISEEKINVNIDNIEKAEQLFNSLNFKNIVNVNYDVIVYEKDNLELAFQDVEGLGILLEYENESDFTDYTNEEILLEKQKMLNEIKKYNLNVSDDYDVKKAFELISKNL